MLDAISRLLQVRREEGGLLLLALAFAFTSVAQTAVIRIFADAILLTEFDASYLPGFFIGSSIAFMAASVLYASGLGRTSSVRLNTWLLVLLAAFSLAARPLYPVLGPAFVFALCLLLTVAAPLSRILCWNAITECFDVRQAKRLLPIAGAGSTAGAIVAGLLTEPFVGAAGTDDLLYVVALLFAAMAPIPRLLARRAVTDVSTTFARVHRPEEREGYLRATVLGFRTIRNNRLVATLAAILFVAAVVACLVDYSLKTALQREFGKDEIAIFLGQYQALVNALIMVLQLFVVGRVLLAFGVRVVFALLPVAIVAGALTMAIEPLFAAIVGIAFAELLLRYTFQNSAGEMVLTPVTIVERNRAKVVMKGVLVPLGGLLAGLLLLPIRDAWPETEDAWRAVAWLVVALGTLWLYLVVRVKRHYVAQLEGTLGFGRVLLEPEIERSSRLDGDAVQALVHNLEHERPEEMDLSLDLLASGLKHIPKARLVLGHPSPRVRMAALRAIATYRLAWHRRRVLGLLGRETDPGVLHAALVALRAIGDERDKAAVAPFAEHPEAPVRAEAVLFLFQVGDEAERRLARQTAERWMAGSPEQRSRAAYLIGEMARQAANPGEVEGPAPWDIAALGELLSDRDRAVRMAAYAAVGRARAQVYLPRLVQALTVRDEGDSALGALRSFGAAAVPALMRAYRGRGCPRRLQLRIVQALGSLEATDSVFALIELLKEGDAEVRRLAIRSLHRLRKTVTPRAFLRERLTEALLNEVRLGHLCSGLMAEARAARLDGFFVDEVASRLRGTVERIFDLLGLLYDVRVMRALHRRYQVGPAPLRSNALELLENTVDPDLRKPLTRVLEDASLEEKARRARLAWSLSEGSSFAATLLDATDDRWLQRCLLCVSGADLVNRYPSRRREVEAMLPMLQRVILFKSVPLFSELSGEALYPVAEIAEEVSVPRDTVIFEEGDVGTYLYVVVTGEVEILRAGTPVARLRRRNAFGEMALLDDRPRSATAVAREDTTLLRIGSEAFGDLLDQHPEISRGIIRVLLSCLRGGVGPQPV